MFSIKETLYCCLLQRQLPNPNQQLENPVDSYLLNCDMQTVQYIQPQHAAQLSQAELVVIDEAAAIPLPMVKTLLGPYLVFLCSTVNGYEGTGRSLSLKLIEQLRSEVSLSLTIPQTLYCQVLPTHCIEQWLLTVSCARTILQ